MTDYDNKLEDISSGLIANIDALVESLFSGVPICKNGNSYRVGRKGSLVIDRCGANAGRWYSHEEQDGGGIIRLVQFALRLSFAEAVKWGEDFLNLDLPAYAKMQRPQSVKRLQVTGKEKLQKKKIIAAQQIWNQAQSVKGTIAGQYLNSRSIETQIVPSSIRFLPMLSYFTNPRLFFPALVGAVTNVQGEITCVHAVYLDEKTGRKVSIDSQEKLCPSKLSKGVLKGSAVKFNPTNSTSLIVTEGIEDALSILQLKEYGVEVWAGCGGNLSNLIIPKTKTDVTIACDADVAGCKMEEKLALRLRNEGKNVTFEKPLIGKDFNEMLMEVRNEN